MKSPTRSSEPSSSRGPYTPPPDSTAASATVDGSRCTATTRKGARCKNHVKADGLCAVHARVAEPSTSPPVKTVPVCAARVASAVTGHWLRHPPPCGLPVAGAQGRACLRSVSGAEGRARLPAVAGAGVACQPSDRRHTGLGARRLRNARRRGRAHLERHVRQRAGSSAVRPRSPPPRSCRHSRSARRPWKATLGPRMTRRPSSRGPRPGRRRAIAAGPPPPGRRATGRTVLQGARDGPGLGYRPIRFGFRGAARSGPSPGSGAGPGPAPEPGGELEAKSSSPSPAPQPSRPIRWET